MLNKLYQDWAYGCLPAALFTLVILVSCVHQLTWSIFLVWMQTPFYLLHEFEEHAYPGKFRQFINLKLFESGNPAFPLTEAGVFWINIPMIWCLFPLMAILTQHVSLSFGLTLPYFTLFNATTHMIAASVKRSYNPGLFCSIVLNYPTCIYTIMYLNSHDHLSISANVWGFLFAIAGHLIMFGTVFSYYKWKKA